MTTGYHSLPQSCITAKKLTSVFSSSPSF